MPANALAASMFRSGPSVRCLPLSKDFVGAEYRPKKVRYRFLPSLWLTGYVCIIMGDLALNLSGSSDMGDAEDYGRCMLRVDIWGCKSVNYGLGVNRHMSRMCFLILLARIEEIRSRNSR